MGNYLGSTASLSQRGNFDSLSLSGGGVCGVVHLGAIQALDELGLYKNFTKFSGASIGSIVAALCAVGATPQQLLECMNFNFEDLLDDDYGCARDVLRLWREFGYYKGDVLLEKIKDSIKSINNNPDITFGELTTELFIPVTMVWKSGCETKIYSKELTPDFSVALACRMSCTYPAVFRSIDCTTDGGILCNYPIELLPHGSRLGIRLVYAEQDERVPVETFEEYIVSIFKTLHSSSDKPIDEQNTINVPVSISSMNFSVSDDQRKQLLEDGKSAVMEFFHHT